MKNIPEMSLLIYIFAMTSTRNLRALRTEYVNSSKEVQTIKFQTSGLYLYYAKGAFIVFFCSYLEPRNIEFALRCLNLCSAKSRKKIINSDKL